MGRSGDALFSCIGQELDQTTQQIYNAVLSTSPEIAASAQRRDALRQSIRQSLDELVQGFFGVFDNVGSVLPEGELGFSIVDVEGEKDIRIANDDYADMWLDYLAQKTSDSG